MENTGDSDRARPIGLAMGEEDTGEHILLDMPEGTYTNTAPPGLDEGGHEVTDSDTRHMQDKHHGWRGDHRGRIE